VELASFSVRNQRKFLFAINAAERTGTARLTNASYDAN
jgi:hypothetical protein